MNVYIGQNTKNEIYRSKHNKNERLNVKNERPNT